MTKLRVESFTISIDGFGAGPDQSLENPLGVGGTALHGWAFATRTFQAQLFGNKDGETGIDDDFAARGFHNVGAWIMGRNMLGVTAPPLPLSPEFAGFSGFSGAVNPVILGQR